MKDNSNLRKIRLLVMALLMASLVTSFSIESKNRDGRSQSSSSYVDRTRNRQTQKLSQLYGTVSSSSSGSSSASSATSSTGSSASGCGSSSSGVPSSTAIEAAITVEFEPVSELQRRIEDGIHYEHWPEYSGTYHQQYRYKRTKNNKGGNNHNIPNDDDIDEVFGSSTAEAHGVFCGYRSTAEERSRLRSADPNDI